MPEEEHDGASGTTLRVASNIDKDILSKRLNPIDNASYRGDQGCMEGTRTRFINDIVSWAIDQPSMDVSPQNPNVDGMLWIYGMPGIGKSTVARSICRRLDESKQLGGSFFCRRDDPARSETKSVLPTLIYGLAGLYEPYGNRVAQALRDNQQLVPESASGELFLSSLQSLEAHPLQRLVLVIDALDECSEPATHRQLLGHLLKACQRNKWLKFIVISRPVHDIRSFFNEHGVVDRDLGQDDNSRTDIRYFAMARMKMVADELHVSQYPEPWVDERRLNHIVNRSGGLFIFVETLCQYLRKYRNPKPPLNRLLEGPSEEASIELHKLYLAAIESRVDSEAAESRLIARATIGVAPYRPLCDKAIAAFTGVDVGLVSSWVDDLGSLLYRDHTMQGGIRVRHISIFEYFTGSVCPLDFRVDLKQADVELSMYTLQTMMTELRFNICGLETSYLPNSDMDNLPERVQKHISNILQYSCLHWFSHLCANLDPESKEVCESLDSFLRGERFLYWLEVLSVMGKVPTAIVALRKIIACSRQKFDDNIVNVAKEALRFVLAFFAPISTSAPHIYLSALPFTPSESTLWKATCKSFPKLTRVCEGQTTKWPRFANLWMGHTGEVTCIAYSPDGLNVVSCSEDRTIRIWDATTGAQVGGPLKGHALYVTSVAYSPDGRKIVSCSGDRTIRIWDAASGAPVGTLLGGHSSVVTSVAYSPDCHNIVTGSEDCTIRIWDVTTGKPVGEPLTGHTSYVTSVAYSPDGHNIVSSSYDQTIRIWVAATGAPVGEPLKGHVQLIGSIAYSPDGQNIVSGSADKTIRIWDTATGAQVGEPLTGHTNGVRSVAYSPDGQYIISGSKDNTIIIWDAVTRMSVGEPLKGHTSIVNVVAYSPDGRNIVSGSLDRTIRIWDTTTEEPVTEPLVGHTGAITSVAYSPDGHNIVTGSNDNTIRIWDATTGLPINGPLKSDSNCLAYSPDSRHFVAGSSNHTVQIWDAVTGERAGEPLRGHTGSITSVAYSPNGRNIVSGSEDTTIRIWDAVTRELVGEPLKGYKGSVLSVKYSPDSQRIVSGSLYGTIHIWDAATRSPIGEPLTGHTGGINSVAYSPDGRNIISGAWDNTIRIWDAVTGVSGAPIGEPIIGHYIGVRSVAYSPDGRNIVSGSWDRTIRIWDAVTGVPVTEPLKGHTLTVNDVAYSPDGRNIVSVSSDNTIRVWDAERLTNNDKISSSAVLGLPSRFLDNVMFNSSGSNAISNIALDSKCMDSQGWIRCDNGILLWIPEDCRHGVTSHAIMTIPPDPQRRCVRLDLSNFKYGESWNDLYCDTS
ncbi:hypothetical protein M408DRAFT_140192 [Serendipita vermifera MAFF 305830]|uniref:Nephrocystin 3-like N-terminal domain-containing protein n=1 Tax=Serendipita vermifera MAFF 305830 TaxID=933852 RepID=A0A0C3B872_SERVB|nr:hypothetical protein M408DRAFT_140192 [Serendipita vermifera MAFF 305830]